MELKIKQTKNSEEKVVKVECFEDGGDIVLMVEGFFIFALTKRGTGVLYHNIDETGLQTNKRGALKVREA